MGHFGDPGSDLNISVRQIACFDAIEEICHMRGKTSACNGLPLNLLGFLHKGYGFHPGCRINLRDNLPAIAVKQQGAVLADECKTVFSSVRAVLDSAGVIPAYCEIIIDVGCQQCVRRFHCVTGICEFASCGINCIGQVSLHSQERIIKQVHSPV